MTREDIIRMARGAASKFGCWDDWDSNEPCGGPNGNDPHEERTYWINLIQFIAAAENEACAKVAELVAREIDDTNGTASYIVAAIRARGNT